MANNGTVVIGIYSYYNTKRKSYVSHIYMIVPGNLIEINDDVKLYGSSFSKTRGVTKVPRILECGYEVSTNKDIKKGNDHPICRAMDAKRMVMSNFFKYIP